MKLVYLLLSGCAATGSLRAQQKDPADIYAAEASATEVVAKQAAKAAALGSGTDPSIYPKDPVASTGAAYASETGDPVVACAGEACGISGIPKAVPVKVPAIHHREVSNYPRGSHYPAIPNGIPVVNGNTTRIAHVTRVDRVQTLTQSLDQEISASLSEKFAILKKWDMSISDAEIVDIGEKLLKEWEGMPMAGDSNSPLEHHYDLFQQAGNKFFEIYGNSWFKLSRDPAGLLRGDWTGMNYMWLVAIEMSYNAETLARIAPVLDMWSPAAFEDEERSIAKPTPNRFFAGYDKFVIPTMCEFALKRNVSLVTYSEEVLKSAEWFFNVSNDAVSMGDLIEGSKYVTAKSLEEPSFVVFLNAEYASKIASYSFNSEDLQKWGSFDFWEGVSLIEAVREVSKQYMGPYGNPISNISEPVPGFQPFDDKHSIPAQHSIGNILGLPGFMGFGGQSTVRDQQSSIPQESTIHDDIAAEAQTCSNDEVAAVATAQTSGVSDDNAAAAESATAGMNAVAESIAGMFGGAAVCTNQPRAEKAVIQSVPKSEWVSHHAQMMQLTLNWVMDLIVHLSAAAMK